MKKNVYILFVIMLLNLDLLSQEVQMIITIENRFVEPAKIRLIDQWLDEESDAIEITLINLSHQFETINNIGARGTISINNEVLFHLPDTQLGICDLSGNLQNVLQNFVNPGGTSSMKLNQIYNMRNSGYCGYEIVNQALYTKLVNTNTIPRGYYNICIEVFDLRDRNRVLGYYCDYFEVIEYLPPLLIQPYNGEVLNYQERPNFKWTTVLPPPPENVDYDKEIYYILKVVELLEGQSVYNALRYNFALFTINQLSESSQSKTEAIWPDFVKLPEPGKKYVWGVQAVIRSLESSSGYIPATAQNEGYSEPFYFEIKKDLPQLITPEDNAQIYSSPIFFSWTMNDVMSGIIPQRVLVYRVDNSQNGYNLLPNSGNIIYEDFIKDNNDNNRTWDYLTNNRTVNILDDFYWTIEYIDRYDNQIKYIFPNKFNILQDSSRQSELDELSNAPFLIAPEGQLDDVNVMFRWEKSAYAASSKIETVYDLYVVEVIEGQNIEDAINNNQYVVSQENIQGTSFQYYSDRLFPSPGANYVWTVYERGIKTNNYIEAFNGPFYFTLPKAMYETAGLSDYSVENCFSQNYYTIQDYTAGTMNAESLKGDSVSIGGFQMQINNIEGKFNDASGFGTIYIPLLDKVVETSFSNIKINNSKQVIEGSVYAEVDENSPFYFYSNLAQEADPDSVKNGLKNISNYLVNKENAENSKVPFYFDPGNNSNSNRIIVSNIVFNPAPYPTYLNTFTVLPLTHLNHDIYFLGNIPIDDAGFVIPENRADIDNTLNIWNSDFDSDRLKIIFDSEQHNKLFYNCAGLFNIDLGFNVMIPAKDANIESSPELNNESFVKIQFSEKVQEWSNWIIKGDTARVIQNDEVIEFIKDISYYFDNSDLLNVRNGIYPNNIEPPKSTARGIIPAVTNSISDSSAKYTQRELKEFPLQAAHMTEPVIFPIGKKKFPDSYKWIIKDLKANFVDNSNRIQLSWKVNEALKSNFRIIVFKSIGEKGLSQVGEIISTGSSSEYIWTDNNYKETAEFFRYAVRIISTNGETETSEIIEFNKNN